MPTTTSPATAGTGPSAHTLPLQRLVNAMVRGTLRAPVLGRVVGRRLLTLYVVGRRSGRQYAVPVAYTRYHDDLVVGSQFAWARNLRTGETIDVRLAGKRRRAAVRVVADEAGVVQHLARMARDNHQFAKFNGIGLDEHGAPVDEDLRRAWTGGGRVAVLTPEAPRHR